MCGSDLSDINLIFYKSALICKVNILLIFYPFSWLLGSSQSYFESVFLTDKSIGSSWFEFSLILNFRIILRFPRASLVAQTVKNRPATRETWVPSLEKDFTFTFHFHALEKETAAHSRFLPGESHAQRSLVGYSHGVSKNWTQLSS